MLFLQIACLCLEQGIYNLAWLHMNDHSFHIKVRMINRKGLYFTLTSNFSLSHSGVQFKAVSIFPVLLAMTSIKFKNTLWTIAVSISSIEWLQGINVLSMRNCTSRVSLPDSICNLAHLTFLNLYGCSNLYDFPDSLRNTYAIIENQ